MDAIRIAKAVAVANAILALISFLYISGFESGGSPAMLMYGLGAPAVPLLSAWLGARLARTPGSKMVLAGAIALAAVIFAFAFVAVLSSNEPLAPLLLVLTALWQAAGMAVLLLIVWLLGRRA